ncbi:Iron(3+)-hydroxamate import ATP-binding protein FhuC [Actinomyces bovis]|uniref:Iron(3+)-hydroxamate import ATP-binding protein FhuC n=1 Tax=Actinomyces bovis TaxID=1658 RepID=A0ABY1VQ68_9ACTO|nr:ATP-binding cassette domain-containing protein [Actinomyces bovis]SPT53948.1 Iron(3+)-hydroxamate import ATP-binding protein FhuC [Actinomyces bovis]VEG53463.1 Iron(3+)-hydroxamate import ATP-binding protein FhuC [Actinomyces israelii]
MIQLDRVTIAYDAEPVVTEVSLCLPEQGVTALIGPNGAGKSTLLSGIGRLLPLSGGRVLVDDRDVRRWERAALARRMAILRQDNHMSVRLTVGELVLLGRYPHCEGRPGRQDHEVAAEAIAQVGLQACVDRFLDELSGGQRQRALIAMTLAQQSTHLLLDEPLSALDLRNARDMMRHITRIGQERGVGVVIVIHDVNTAAAYADRIIALKDGRVAADGSPQEVMTEEVLGKVFEVEVQVVELEGRPVAFPRR